MHEWDTKADLLANSVLDYTVERLKVEKDSRWGARPASELAAALDGAVSGAGIGGDEALRLFRDVLMPACRPMDDPRNLAYVPTAPTIAATLFDLVVSASSIFGGVWESGAGAIAAENQALRWLADLAGFPPEAGGTFVSGGSAANLSALVAARHAARQGRDSEPARWMIAATGDTHASIVAAARVMDIDVLPLERDARGRLTGAELRSALDRHRDEHGLDGLFAVVANAGTTNAGAVDDLDGIADVCADEGLWMHIDAAYGGAALCAPSAAGELHGFHRADSFGVDPHKWLFAPYDCAALVYRDPTIAAAAHAQHGDYLDSIDRGEWNPSDYAFQLSRRARGLPLWFSLATYGSDAYTAAVEETLRLARWFADQVDADPRFELLLHPQLSVVMFRHAGWSAEDYAAWTASRARAGRFLVVPTKWQGETCYRVCIVNPRTTEADLRAILDDMAEAAV